MNTRVMTIHNPRHSLLLIGAAAMFILAGIFSGCATGSRAKTVITDTDVTAGVTAGLAEDESLAAYSITVTTADGVVRLDGNVPRPSDRDNAEKIAAASRGVVRVDNYIQFGGKQFDAQ